MGCGGSRNVLEKETGIHCMLNNRMYKIGLDRIDKYF
jgi:hypothetical protein